MQIEVLAELNIIYITDITDCILDNWQYMIQNTEYWLIKSVFFLFGVYSLNMPLQFSIGFRLVFTQIAIDSKILMFCFHMFSNAEFTCFCLKITMVAGITQSFVINFDVHIE